MISTVSITDLKQNTSNVVKNLRKDGKSVVVLQRSKIAAVLVDPQYFSILEESLEDLIDLKAIDERKKEKRLSLEKVVKNLG
jgi:prevent-host-death family protein